LKTVIDKFSDEIIHLGTYNNRIIDCLGEYKYFFSTVKSNIKGKMVDGGNTISGEIHLWSSDHVYQPFTMTRVKKQKPI